MNDFLRRISSRKFLDTLAVQVVAFVTLVRPDLADDTNKWAVQIVSLIVLLVSTVFYVKTEGKIDQSTATSESAYGQGYNDGLDDSKNSNDASFRAGYEQGDEAARNEDE